jgi:hypothetical protein
MYTEGHLSFFFGVTFTATLSSFFMGYQITALNPIMHSILKEDWEFCIYTTLVPFGAMFGVVSAHFGISYFGRFCFIV